MPKGGYRKNAGRKKTEIKLPKGIAGNVLRRIGELNLTFPSGKKITSQEDFALALLGSKDERIRKESFIEFVHQEYGRPVTKTENTHDFAENSSFKIIVEHIGRSQDKAPTKTK